MNKKLFFIMAFALLLGACEKKTEDKNCYQVKSLGSSWFKEGAIVVEFTDQNQGMNLPEATQRRTIALLNIPEKFQANGTIFYVTLHYDSSKDIIDKTGPVPAIHTPVKVYISDSVSEKACSIN